MTRCRGPNRRLIAMRGKNGVGSFFQNIGNGLCARGPGNFIGSGGGTPAVPSFLLLETTGDKLLLETGATDALLLET